MKSFVLAVAVLFGMVVSSAQADTFTFSNFNETFSRPVQDQVYVVSEGYTFKTKYDFTHNDETEVDYEWTVKVQQKVIFLGSQYNLTSDVKPLHDGDSVTITVSAPLLFTEEGDGTVEWTVWSKLGSGQWEQNSYHVHDFSVINPSGGP